MFWKIQNDILFWTYRSIAEVSQSTSQTAKKQKKHRGDKDIVMGNKNISRKKYPKFSHNKFQLCGLNSFPAKSFNCEISNHVYISLI